MGALEPRTKIIVLIAVVVTSASIFYTYNSKVPWFLSPSIWYDDEQYTRGMIHYQTMDSGLGDCWTQTAKNYLKLACPIMQPKSELELELAFLITSCYCETTARIPLRCNTKKQSLSKCATDQCYNHHGYDAFETVFIRMYPLCHYYLQEMSTTPNMKSPLSHHELNELIYEAKGAGTGRPVLKNLLELAQNEIRRKDTKYQSSIISYWDDFLMSLEDLGYHLGIVKYEFDH